MSPKPNQPDKKNESTDRAPYQPPQITYTEIEAEEALMGYCKAGSSAGPEGSSCTIPPCSSPGS